MNPVPDSRPIIRSFDGAPEGTATKTSMNIRAKGLCASVLLSATLAFPQAGEIATRLGLGGQSSLSNSKVTSGLKEALRVGAEKSISIAGRHDGFFANQAIKILMPRDLRQVEKGLRMMGYGPKVDEFILSMNRAAEAASPSAKKIFGDAIVAMTFDDARKILSGGNTTATDYFKNKTTDQLTAAFHPVVEKVMKDNGVTEKYDTMLGQANSIPFMKSQNLDINQYVVSKTLDGLFYLLGQQETKIRKDPAARTTSLLKEVFKR
jgi:hypothetical protein